MASIEEGKMVAGDVTITVFDKSILGYTTYGEPGALDCRVKADLLVIRRNNGSTRTFPLIHVREWDVRPSRG